MSQNAIGERELKTNLGRETRHNERIAIPGRSKSVENNRKTRRTLDFDLHETVRRFGRGKVVIPLRLASSQSLFRRNESSLRLGGRFLGLSINSGSGGLSFSSEAMSTRLLRRLHSYSVRLLRVDRILRGLSTPTETSLLLLCDEGYISLTELRRQIASIDVAFDPRTISAISSLVERRFRSLHELWQRKASSRGCDGERGGRERSCGSRKSICGSGEDDRGWWRLVERSDQRENGGRSNRVETIVARRCGRSVLILEKLVESAKVAWILHDTVAVRVFASTIGLRAASFEILVSRSRLAFFVGVVFVGARIT